MELKQGSDPLSCEETEVLIVPSGIETFTPGRLQSFPVVLIVPSGIETL